MAFPDGFLNLTVIFVTSVLGISLIVLALNQVQAEYQEKAIVTISNNLHKRET
jgi:heme exporter protein D